MDSTTTVAALGVFVLCSCAAAGAAAYLHSQGHLQLWASPDPPSSDPPAPPTTTTPTPPPTQTPGKRAKTSKTSKSPSSDGGSGGSGGSGDDGGGGGGDGGGGSSFKGTCKAMPAGIVKFVNKYRGTKQYKLNDYREEMVKNKRALMRAMEVARVPQHYRLLLLAMAMQETNTLTAKSRDAGKDNSGGAANVSLYNLNVDMVQRLGYKGSPSALNEDARVADVLRLLLKAFKDWGVERTLNFVRGGYTAFVDGKSYGVDDFKNGIVTIMQVLCREGKKILSDGRRVEVYTKHV